jgi:predicted nucleotidyltransferase
MPHASICYTLSIMLGIEEIKHAIIPILLEDASELKRVVLFGSHARREATDDSDIDVNVDGVLNYDFCSTMDTAEKASAATGVPVELITKNALTASVIRESLERSIEQDGVLLYGQ